MLNKNTENQKKNNTGIGAGTSIEIEKPFKPLMMKFFEEAKITALFSNKSKEFIMNSRQNKAIRGLLLLLCSVSFLLLTGASERGCSGEEITYYFEPRTETGTPVIILGDSVGINSKKVAVYKEGRIWRDTCHYPNMNWQLVYNDPSQVFLCAEAMNEGDTIFAAGGSGTTGAFAISSNSGITWLTQPPALGLNGGIIDAAATTKGLIALFKTSTNERRLLLKPSLFAAGWQQLTNPSSTRLNDVAAYWSGSPTTFHCIAGGNNGNLYYSSNSGTNWINRSIGVNKNIYQVLFLSQTKWVAAGDTFAAVTTNSGINWRMSNVATFNSTVLTLRQENNTWLLAGGSNGRHGQIFLDGGDTSYLQGSMNSFGENVTQGAFLREPYGGFETFSEGFVVKTENASGGNVSMIHYAGRQNFIELELDKYKPYNLLPLNNATVNTRTPALDWTDFEECYGTRIQVATDTNFTNLKINRYLSNASNFTIPVDSLAYSTRYYWKVKHYWDSFTQEQTTSNWSNRWSFITPPPAPAAPVLFSPANNSTGLSLTPQLVWRKSINATTYRVQVSTNSSFSTLIINDSTLTDSLYNVPSGLLQNNTQYFWRVNAKNVSGTSAYSTQWNFTAGFVGVSQNGNEIPAEYKLYDNYPNPFNPSTKIKFALPKQSFVKITVYDMLGREIESLVKHDLSAGYYSVDWPAEGGASKYSSGVYFYKIDALEFTDVKKMMLVK